MATNNNSNASPEATREAQKIWHHFVEASKWCGIAIAVVLILMAVFLV